MLEENTITNKFTFYQNIGLHDCVKGEILRICHTLGYQAKPEYKGTDWRSDVFVSVNGIDYAFEVQITKQSLNKTIERQEKYKRDGVIGCWLFETEPSKLEEREDIPAFKITNIEGQIIVSIKDRKELPLEIFISDYLQNKIRFCPEIVIMPKQEVEVTFIEINCWKCRTKHHVYYIPYYSSSCNSRIFFEEMWSSKKTKFHPDVIRQIRDYAQTEKGKHLYIGEIKERYSKTTGHSYISFGCPKCDSILGDWFMHEAIIDTMYEKAQNKTTCIIELKDDLRGHVPHWCHPGDKPFCDQVEGIM